MLTVQFFTYNPFQENTYLIFNDQKEAIIIDPGCYSKPEQQSLLQYISDQKLKLVQLVNTHCHLDHIFGNNLIASTFGLDLNIHPNEQQVLQLAPQAGAMYGVPVQPYTGRVQLLNEGDIVKLGQDEFKVLLTPGHSPGSICLYHKDEGFVIGGDVLFRDSIGRTDLPGGNHQALLISIRDQLFTLPPNVTVYPGHGPATTIGHEKEHNPFLSPQ